jgi:NADPH:quinone reductase-like Zn-dependent oxidoreductase
MKTVVYRTYGSPDVLEIRDVDTPVPRDNEVLIRVRAASVNPIDWHFLRGEPYIGRIAMGLRKPRHSRLGHDVAGQVEAVGRSVTRFKAGDEVFGMCDGACAEYACASESALVVKPARVTFEQAASIPVAALTALQGLRNKGNIQAGQNVLINGAAGGVGTFAVQIAKSFQTDVTGVCSTRNVEMVRSIGADHVVDYTKEDFADRGQRYDLFLDCVLNHSLSACRRVLNPNGIHVIVGAPASKWLIGLLARAITGLVVSRFASRKFGMFITRSSAEDLTFVVDLISAGKVRPVIDRRYPLSDAAEAIRYLEQGHARGKIVISMGGAA